MNKKEENYIKSKCIECCGYKWTDMDILEGFRPKSLYWKEETFVCLIDLEEVEHNPWCYENKSYHFVTENSNRELFKKLKKRYKELIYQKKMEKIKKNNSKITEFLRKND